MKQKFVNYPNKFRACVCNNGADVVSVSVSLCVGAEQEPKSLNGICHLIERLLRSQISEQVGDFGGVVETYTDFEHIEISVTTMREFLPKLMEIVSSIIFNFSPKSVSLDREKEKILREIEKEASNPFAILQNLSQYYMYKGTALSTKVIGNEKTIASIQMQDVKNFYNEMLSPENVIVAVVGDVKNSPEKEFEDVEFGEVIDLVNRYFYSYTLKLEQHKKVKYVPSVALSEPYYCFKQKTLNQTRFQISFPSAPYNSNGYAYSKLLQIYMNIYLRINLANTFGVYNLDVSIRQFKNNAHFSISYAVDEDCAEEVYHKIIKLVDNVKVDGITNAEFVSLINRYKIEIALEHEKTIEMAKRLNKWLFLKDTPFDLMKELEIISGLPYHNMSSIINSIFDYNIMLVAVVGRKMEDFSPFDDLIRK